MIVGNGDISKALRDGGLDRPDVMFFARGVSNSGETNRDEFLREIIALLNIREPEHIVYFSSLSVYYGDSIYTAHKKHMEYVVGDRYKNHTIIRLGNITWGDNPNTIINYFKACYQNGIQPELQNTYRHLVSWEEFEYWIDKIQVGKKDIMNIPGEFIHVKEIWKRVTDGKY